jgi:hypothetical protein
VAYSLTKSGDWVIRGGGGIFYDQASDSVGNLGSVFPNNASSFAFAVPLPLADANPFLPVISLLPPFPNGTLGYVPNLKLPRSYQWNVSLEKSFKDRQAVSVSYVGQAGRDLLRQEALAQPNPNFLGAFVLTGNGAYSNYHALQLQYRRPLSDRLQALVNYTWSHSLDNASSDVVEALSGAVISAARDYASSDFDVRQTFSGAVSYDFPSPRKNPVLSALARNWSTQAVIVARTGFPYNATVPTATIAGVSPRPDLVLGQPIYIASSRAPGGKMLNPLAFAFPPAGEQGTEGRNDIPGFGLTQLDLSLARKFFLTDAFNLLNHPNFTNPLAFYLGPSDTTFLQSTEMLNHGLGGLNSLFQQGGPRSLQLSLKLNF